MKSEKVKNSHTIVKSSANLKMQISEISESLKVFVTKTVNLVKNQKNDKVSCFE